MQPVRDNEAIVARPRYEADRKLIVLVSCFKRSRLVWPDSDVANINTLLLASPRKSRRHLPQVLSRIHASPRPAREWILGSRYL